MHGQWCTPELFRSLTHTDGPPGKFPDPTCPLATDDQESDTGRSVYCPALSRLLYSAHSSPNFLILRVVENRARVLRSNLQPLHPRPGSRS
jgi:hypothetical protein